MTGHKYVTFDSSSSYIGTKGYFQEAGPEATEPLMPYSPMPRAIKQDQYSIDMELFDSIAITSGSFKVLKDSGNVETVSGTLAYLLPCYELFFTIQNTKTATVGLN